MTAARLLAGTDVDFRELRDLIHPVEPELVVVRPAPAILKLLWGPGIAGVSLGQTILIDPDLLSGPNRPSPAFLIHELVHCRQWAELGVFGFLWTYLGDYLWARTQGFGHRAAYFSIRLEVEAREAAHRFG